MYCRHGRVTIRPFIADAEAEQLGQDLLRRKDWRVRMKGEGPRTYEFAREDLEQWEPAKLEALRRLVAPSGEETFSYVYERIVIRDEENRPCEKGTPLAEFAAFMSSQPVLDLIARITGEDRIEFADAFASRYTKGDYLTIHQDGSDSNRRVAYVFGLSTGWRPEWGGLLLFHDDEGNVGRGICPQFNTLTLFAVPQKHSVTLVAPFAPTARLSVAGWFRSS